MKLFFVNPPSPDKYVYIRDLNRSGRRSKEGTIWPQTSLALIAGMFPEDDCRIIDCIAERRDYPWLKQAFKEEKPDWVIFNSISSTISSDMLTAYYAKAVGASTATVGAHVKALGDLTRQRFPCLDHAISGEPEVQLRNLIKGETNAQVKIDELPPARHDLLPLDHYRLPFIGRGYTFIHTSRGCPWECIYCRQTVMWDGRNKGIQLRSPEKIVQEIKDYKLTNFIFHADTATVNKTQLLTLCKLLEPLKVRWCCNSRVDTVDPEKLAAMKKAGCWMIMFGVESGNDDVLKANKKEATVAQAEQAVAWTKAAGIKVWGYFMLGLWKETPGSMRDTLALALRMRCDIVNFAIAAPYPGTEFGKKAQAAGQLAIDPEEDWEAYDQNYSAIYENPDVPPKELKRFMKWCYLRWYLRPYGFWKILKAVRLTDLGFWCKVVWWHLTG